MSRLTIASLTALALAFGACAQEAAEEAGTAEETAAVDAATVEQTIRSAGEQYEQAALAADTETLVSLYTDDAVLLAPGMPRAEGIDAVRSAYQEMYAAGAPSEASIDPGQIVVSENGDMAYEIGSFTFSGTGPDGTPFTDTGKYVAIWKPTATGEWKIAVDTWNSDVMPGAEAGGTGETAPETGA